MLPHSEVSFQLAQPADLFRAERTYVSELRDVRNRWAQARLEEKSYEELAEAVSPRETVGWPAVDEEIRELRRRFRSSTTPQDYRAVGTHCVGVIEALSRTVYNPERHLRSGEIEPPVDKSKQRLDRYIQDALPGEPNEEMRGLAKRAVPVAHQIKHRPAATRRDAGIAADTVILLANILRRLDNEQVQQAAG